MNLSTYFSPKKRQNNLKSDTDALYHLGMVYEGAGRFDDAINTYQQGVNIDQTGTDIDTINWAGAALKHNGIAECYRKSGDLNTCNQYYQHAIDQGTTAWGENHPNLAVFYSNRATYEMQQGFLDEAEELFQKALNINEAALPEDHPSLAVNLNNLGQLRQQQANYAEAEELFERALKIDRKVYGEKHPETATCMVNLAAAKQELGKLNEALNQAQEARNVLVETLGNEHPNTALAYRVCGRLLVLKGRAGKAVDDLRHAADTIEAFYGEKNSATAEAKADLGYALLHSGAAAEALDVLRDAEDVFGSTIGMQHPGILQIQRNLAQAHLVEDDIVGAAAVFQELGRTARQQDSWALAYEAHAILVAMYLQSGLNEEAAKLLGRAREAKSMAGKVMPLDQRPLITRTLENLMAGGKEEDAFKFHAMVLALDSIDDDQDLGETGALYRKQIDPDHIEYALDDDEVFAMPVFTPETTFYFTVTAAKGLKVLKEIGGADFDLTEFIEQKRPGMTLVTVAEMLERTTEAMKANYEEAAQAHEQATQSYEEACTKLQQQMQEDINKAIAEGRYEDVAKITAEMTEKITKLGEQFGS